MKDLEQLRKIYDKTDGYCHLCHKKLSFINHGRRGSKGAWHRDHSLARANGGSNHLNNFYPACIDCNEQKSTYSAKSVRNANGLTRAPHSRRKKEKLKRQYANNGMIIGGLLGAILGPEGAIIGAIVGRAIGSDSAPRR